MIKKLCFLSVLVFFVTGCGSDFQVVDLTVEYKNNPLGIDSENPVFSWKISGTGYNRYQTAYHIIVTDEQGRVFWDTGKVLSAQSTLISYSGNSLTSNSRYNWKIKVWDETGNSSGWSDPAYWVTAFVEGEEWEAAWIGPDIDKPGDSAHYYRKEFNIDRRISEATVYISGLGYYELSVNGEKVGDHVLDPAQTDYEKRVFYAAYDITSVLSRGNNVAGIIVGNGWYHQQVAWGGRSYGIPRVTMHMIVKYNDGTEETILTDETWKVSTGPIVYNSIYKGEVYDARLEIPGWDRPGFNDSGWENVSIMNSPGGAMESQNIPPIRETERLNPQHVYSLSDSLKVFDLGQNISGYAEIYLNGIAGIPVRLRFAETLNDDRTIDVASTGVMATTSEQIDTYICKGANEEKYKPRFTYHGYRYVEVKSAPEVLKGFALTGIVVNNDLPGAGSFESSDTLLDRICRTALWTIKGNLHGMLTDCPHRERCGWLGDAHIAAEAVIYNYKSADFWSKYTRDIETSLDKGLPTNVAPGLRIKWVGRADWGAAVVMLPWYVYQYYGDLSPARTQYDHMKRYIEYLESIAEDGVVYDGFGDWYDPPAGGPDAISVPNPKYTSTGITTTSLFYASLEAMVKFSELLGKDEDLEYFQKLKKETKESFNRHFFSVDSAYGSQTANVLALRYGIVEEENRPFVVDCLTRDIASHDYHFTTGMQGAKHLYNILSEEGYGDIAYKVITNRTFPSIPYLFSLGATTNWENWSTTPNQRGVPRSKNHPMNSGYATWFYQSIGGIKPNPDHPGFRQFILQPDFLSELNRARATYQSPYGEILSMWERKDNAVSWKVSVPFNSTATVKLPNGYELTGIYPEDHAPKPDQRDVVLGSGEYELIFKQ